MHWFKMGPFPHMDLVLDSEPFFPSLNWDSAEWQTDNEARLNDSFLFQVVL